MSDRLTEWIDKEDNIAVPRMDMRRNGYEKCIAKLAHYEDLEEQGELIKLPEKITEVTYTDDNTSELDYAAGWNACIDAIMGGINEK